MTDSYLIIIDDLNLPDITDLLRRALIFVAHYEGVVPGMAPRGCGNYKLHSLELTREGSRRYLEEVLEHLDDTNTHYPE